MSSIASANRASNMPRVALASLCAAMLCAGACSSKAKHQATAGEPAPAAAKPATINFPVDHELWAKMGYRLDWVGFPFGSSHSRPIVSTVVTGDSVVLQDKANETAALDVATGERRWSTNLANPLTKFVGLSQDTVDPLRILASSESDGFLVATATGSLTSKERYDRVVNTKPLLIGRLAIFGTSSGEVFAHQMTANVKAWGFMTKGAIEANPVAMNDGQIGVVSQGGDVVILNTSGQLIGRNHILSSVAMNPVTDGNVLFIGGLDQSVWAFNSNGALLWRHRTASKLRDQIAVHEGVVYCTIPGEGFVALDAANGTPKWTSAKTAGSLLGSHGGKLMVRTAKGIDLLDPATGTCDPTLELPGIVQLLTDKAADGVIYAISAKGPIARFIPR
jgi:outer membrane protein assembly factor BamB